MILETEQIISVIEFLEERYGRDLTGLKDEIIGDHSKYETKSELIYDKRVTKGIIKDGNGNILEGVSKVYYIKKHRFCKVIYDTGQIKVVKKMSLYIDLELPIETLINTFNL